MKDHTKLQRNAAIRGGVIAIEQWNDFVRWYAFWRHRFILEGPNHTVFDACVL